MSLARRLRRENEGLFEAARVHPFVRGLGNGSLKREVFERWIVQDWLYLQRYVEALEVASQLAQEASARAFWGELARLTREEELDLHRGLARQFGLNARALEEAVPYGATTEYLATLKAAQSSYPTLVATLTPCAVGYAEIARALDGEEADRPAEYDAWIKTYMDPAFQASVQAFEAEVDRCGAMEGAITAMEGAYREAAGCELKFWEGLWRGR